MRLGCLVSQIRERHKDMNMTLGYYHTQHEHRRNNSSIYSLWIIGSRRQWWSENTIVPFFLACVITTTLFIICSWDGRRTFLYQDFRYSLATSTYSFPASLSLHSLVLACPPLVRPFPPAHLVLMKYAGGGVVGWGSGVGWPHGSLHSDLDNSELRKQEDISIV